MMGAAKVSPAFPRLTSVADHGVLIELDHRIDTTVNRRVHAMAQRLRTCAIAGIQTVIPAYRTIYVGYDSTVIGQRELIAKLREMVAVKAAWAAPSRRWRIPVCYDLAYGLDLETVAAYHGISVEAVIAQHSASVYQVFMIGFLPGLAYIGPLAPALHTPRRATPRQHTPAGCVNIGGAQALISSVSGPSGWHVLGRTPVRLFDPARNPPFLLAQGDELVFASVDAKAFSALAQQHETGAWQVEPECLV